MRATRHAYLTGTVGLLLALLGAPAAAHESLAQYHWETAGRCTTCAGSPMFHWDQFNGGPREAGIYTGTASAFSNCLRLSVGGAVVNAASYSLMPGNRGVRTQEYSSGAIRIIRETYFPEDDLDIGRWVDSFRNTGAGPANVNIQYYCVYRGCTGGYTYYYLDDAGGGAEGRGADECTVGSSDGDENTEASDLWFAWNDEDRSGYPAVAIVTHGDGADEPPTRVNYDGWSTFTIDFALTIPAGETQRLLMFLVQAVDSDSATSTADFLTSLPPEATEGLDPLPDFENFITDGRPAVSMGGPYDVPEGGSVVLDKARMFDREGDPLTFAWDMDGDDIFETLDLYPVFSAEGLDGPDERTVSLYVAEDIEGGHEVTRSQDIEIRNVAPYVVSEPATGARRGGLYSYKPTVLDPAPPETEPMAYELVEDEFPVGMTVALDGTVTWTPRADQLGSHSVELFLEDDDGGEFTQIWSINVTDNTAPYAPNPLYPTIDSCVRVARPTLKVSNSSDLDDDPLFYYFQVDSDAGFRSIDLQESEGVPEDPRGSTEWQVERPLLNDRTYYWRTWVSDTIEDSEKVVGVFNTCITGGDGDTDVDGDTDIDADGDGDGDSDAAGCACSTTGGSSGGALAGLVLLGLLFRRRRNG